MADILISDLLPLRERPKCISVIFMAYAIATALGPIIGGSLAELVSWRWAFYINLPVAAVAFIMLFVTLKVRYLKDTTKNSLRRVDFGGNVFLVVSLVCVLLALTWGGVEYPWSDWYTLVPLVLGFVGLIAFLVTQSLGFVREPTCPLDCFPTARPLRLFCRLFPFDPDVLAGLFPPRVLPSCTRGISCYLRGIPSANRYICMAFTILAGAGLSKFGHYRPHHVVGMACLATGFGLYSLLNEYSSTAYWAGVQ
jgi:MFS family permease